MQERGKQQTENQRQVCQLSLYEATAGSQHTCKGLGVNLDRAMLAGTSQG